MTIPENEIPSSIHPDQILPVAVKEIEKVERVRSGQLHNTVSAIQDVPSLVGKDEENAALDLRCCDLGRESTQRPIFSK